MGLGLIVIMPVAIKSEEMFVLLKISFRASAAQ
jgi:hypothetical protein